MSQFEAELALMPDAPDESAEDWLEQTDADSGQVFWYNQKTTALSMTKPDVLARTAVVAPTADAADITTIQGQEELGEHIVRVLTHGWYECIDPTSQQHYFWHRHSGAVQWEAPTSTDNSESADTAGAAIAVANPITSTTTSDDFALSSGWQVCYDSFSNRLYYWHKPTGRRSWTRPPSRQARRNARATAAAASANPPSSSYD
jgi:hypothetical protein